MPNDSYTQQTLASDVYFRRRVRSSMSAVAWQVQNEDPATTNHLSREKYAQQVIRQLDNEVSIVLPGLVMRPLVFNFATTYQFDFQTGVGQTVSATGDPDIQSQLATDWNDLAAAAGFASA